MSAPLIRATAYMAQLPRDPDLPPGPAKFRYRWRAELVYGTRVAHQVAGYENPDDAIGAVVQAAADECETPADVLALVGRLFGSDPKRSPLIELGRALRFAAREPRRRHPGCCVFIGDPSDAEQTPRTFAQKSRAKAGAKGGVA